jgi:hypothetical protein
MLLLRQASETTKEVRSVSVYRDGITDTYDLRVESKQDVIILADPSQSSPLLYLIISNDRMNRSFTPIHHGGRGRDKDEMQRTSIVVLHTSGEILSRFHHREWHKWCWLDWSTLSHQNFNYCSFIWSALRNSQGSWSCQTVFAWSYFMVVMRQLTDTIRCVEVQLVFLTGILPAEMASETAVDFGV